MCIGIPISYMHLCINSCVYYSSGPVMFGGNSSSNRKSRLFAASPYAAAAMASRKSHQRPLFDESASSSRRGSSAAATPSPAPSPSPSSTTSDNGVMSSTARLIFDTLEKMSTPIRDAQKLIPSVNCTPPRAEKRRAIAEQLDWSHGSLKRRRPQLGGSGQQYNDHVKTSDQNSGQLNGPPLRTVFSPVPPVSHHQRSKATKSARIASSFTAASTSTTNSAEKNLRLSSASSKPFNSMPSVPETSMPSTLSPLVYKHNSSVGSSSSSSSKSTESSIMNIGTWSNTNIRTSDNSNSSGGKMKRESTIRHESHYAPPPPPIPEHSAKNPVLAFLEARNNALPIKNLPAFNLNNEKCPPMVKRESTGSTVPVRSQESILRQHFESSQTSDGISRQDLSSPHASPIRRLDAQSEPAPPTTAAATMNFGFAMPPPLVPRNSMASLEATEANSKTIIDFSFCQPEEVAQVSSMSDPSPHHSSNSTTAKTSPKTSLITNHTTLPDLTASHHDGQNNVKSAPKSLKSGSVMDILRSRKSSL